MQWGLSLQNTSLKPPMSQVDATRSLTLNERSCGGAAFHAVDEEFKASAGDAFDLHLELAFAVFAGTVDTGHTCLRRPF